MPFEENIIIMKEKSKAAANQEKYANQFSPDSKYPNLKLFYPGKLQSQGDYKLEFYNTPLTHPDIVRAIYQFSLGGHGQFIANLLVDIYKNGLKSIHNSNHQIVINNLTIDMDEFKHLVYWIVLQEDINFPRPTYKGVNMPFWRYIEGIVAAEHPDLINIDQVIRRTNNHGAPPPLPFTHSNLNLYLRESLEQIR